MGGFPTRPNRDAFGPDYEDERAVQDATREIAAAIFNLLFHQVSGISRTVPRAVLVCSVSGGAVTTDHQLLAWDPNAALSTLTWTYTSAGRYSLAFASQYENELGNDVNLSLVGGLVLAQGTSFRIGTVDLTSGYELDVLFDNLAGAAANPGAFVLVLW